MRACTIQDGRASVRKERHEIETEARIYEVLKNVPSYSTAQVDTRTLTVSTKLGSRVRLTNIATIKRVLRALQLLHANNVTHGDLKPQHVLQDDAGDIYFIDFGYSIHNPQNLSKATGLTYKYASFDAILRGNRHELDDYEAIFMCALEDLGICVPPLPSKKSKKLWATWKLQLIDFVYRRLFVAQKRRRRRQGQRKRRHPSWSNSPSSTSHGSQPASPALSPTSAPTSPASPRDVCEFVLNGLMLAWTVPRDASRLSPEQQDKLVNVEPVNFKEHAKGVRSLFVNHLGRVDGRNRRVSDPLNAFEPEGDSKSDTDDSSHRSQQKQALNAVQSLNKQVRECSYVRFWPTALERKAFDQPSTRPADETKSEKDADALAEYGSLIFNKRDTWKYDRDWNRLGDVILDAISGKFLYLDTSNDPTKHLWDFANKFEHFVRLYSLRPIDVLLLVVGIQIECHGKALYPRNFGTMLDIVQHGRQRCRQCHANNLGDFDSFYHCFVCKKYLCSDCKCEHEDLVRFDAKSKNLHDLPNLSLFTLLLAGRVCTTNEISSAELDTEPDRSTDFLEAKEKPAPEEEKLKGEHKQAVSSEESKRRENENDYAAAFQADSKQRVEYARERAEYARQQGWPEVEEEWRELEKEMLLEEEMRLEEEQEQQREALNRRFRCDTIYHWALDLYRRYTQN